MAYELAQFAPPENRPGFFKIVGAAVAITIIAGFILVKLYPLIFQDQREKDYVASNHRNAQNMLEVSQSALKYLETRKTSGYTTSQIDDIPIDQAIKETQRDIGKYKEQLAELDNAENIKLKTVGIISAILGVFIGSSIYFGRRTKSIYEAAKANLIKGGYSPDFHVGNIFIDSRAKIIAFVDLASLTYDLYGALDILGWEHQWIDKTEHTKISKVDNVLVFKTNNPTKPLYKVSLSSHREGEEWMARLGAIINA